MIRFDLFLQSAYSFNGSLVDVEKIVHQAKEKGIEALALCDFHRMHGAVKFYRACKSLGILPIIGMEVSVQMEEDVVFALLYAKDNQGYLNLIQLSSKLETTASYVTLDDLSIVGGHLIGVLLTHKGPLYKALLRQDLDFATQRYRMLKKAIPESFLGLDLNDFEYEVKIAPNLEQIGPSVITNFVAYSDTEDKEASILLKKLLKEQRSIDDGLFFDDEISYYLKDASQLTKLYKDYEQAVLNSEALISQCVWNLDFSKRHLPNYPLNAEFEKQDYLRALCEKGMQKRYRNHPRKHPFSDYQTRLKYELDVIHKMGYDDYFLIVWDFVLFAKKSGILVGPGRGSAAGSLVAYVLGIVDVDPLEFDLYFERFLNPERITLPDIDMDFPDIRRDEVIKYVVQKYGKEHVTSIVTFGTFQGKSALRDASRILQMEDFIVNEVTAYVSETDNSIEEFERTQPEKYANLMKNDDIRHLFLVAKKLIGLPKHVSTHAAGIIMTETSILDFSPVQNGLLDMYQTQYEASDLELLGLLKIDFLGIRNLTTIQAVLDEIKVTYHQDIDIYKIPLDDEPTISILRDVHTLGIFQLESKGMMNLVRNMRIQNFEDISTAIALFRPGPMESIPEFLARRSKKKPITYPHESLKEILSYTAGIIVYQEQIMKIANEYAGYSLGEADVLRRAVSKKKEEVLLAERARFLDKCKMMNRDEETSKLIYDTIVKFANYGFNKSHSVAYSVVAYWMSYLKANYPMIFMKVLLDSCIGSQHATSVYVKECQQLNIRVLPPKINDSLSHYVIEKDGLRFPFSGIKGIGTVMADKISEAMKDKPFESFFDFMKRTKQLLNVKVVESMVMVGMFDEFGQNKRTLIENMKAISMVLSNPGFATEEQFVFYPYDEYDFTTLAETERELIGMHFLFHPMSQYLEVFKKEGRATLSDMLDDPSKMVEFVATIKRIKTIKTKNKDEMAFVLLEDVYSSAEGVVFPKDYLKLKDILIPDTICIVRGTTEQRDNRTQIVIQSCREWKGNTR